MLATVRRDLRCMLKDESSNAADLVGVVSPTLYYAATPAAYVFCDQRAGCSGRGTGVGFVVSGWGNEVDVCPLLAIPSGFRLIQTHAQSRTQTQIANSTPLAFDQFEIGSGLGHGLGFGSA